ncbi:putative Multidrug resistance protein mdtA [Magnetospirillum sp. UT-4]|nr:putative Multidrug resistance protein mdtA [Magnetospirillum sp. UT-4]
MAVEAAPVTVGPIARELTAVGSLRSDESVMIRPEIAGRIRAIGFEEGSRVAKGQVLVRLDDSAQAADLQQAQANLGLSRANAERAVRLAGQGAGTERARDEAEAKLRVDLAKVEYAKALLEKTVIVAPFAGTVGLRAVSVGAYVQPGQDIVNLEAIDPIKVDFRIPELFLPEVREGLSVAVAADAFPGREFHGTLYAIDPAIDQNGRALLVRARIQNSEGTLRPGQFVRLALKVDEVASAITVPEESLVPRGEQLMVFKVVDGKAQPVPVKAGKRFKGKVEIVEGLAPGDVVVTAGQMKLRPGAAVNTVTAKAGG